MLKFKQAISRGTTFSRQIFTSSRIAIIFLAAALACAIGYIIICRQQIAFSDSEPFLKINSWKGRNKIACFGIVEPLGAFREMSPENEGIIVRMNAVEKKFFRKGEVLYKMRTDDLENEKLKLIAQKKAAQANLDFLLENPRPEEVAVAEAELLTAKEELNRLAIQMKRSKVLVKQLITSVASDEDIYELWMIQTHKTLLAEKKLIRLKAGVSQFEIAGARAEIEALNAGIKSIETKIENAIVRAPFDGIVFRVNRREGEYVKLHTYSLNGDDDVPVIFGSCKLQVAAEVPEYALRNLAAVKGGVAWRKGASEKFIPLANPQLIPVVVPKKVMTGTVSEVVDVRIIKMVWELPEESGLFPGEQVNVYLEYGVPENTRKLKKSGKTEIKPHDRTDKKAK